MAETDIVRARIDPKVKKRAGAVLKKIGLTTSDAFRMMMIRIASEGQLPFEPGVPNKKTLAAMREAERGGLKAAKNVGELFKALDADD